MRFDCKEKIDTLNAYKNVATKVASVDPVEASKLKYISVYKDQVALEPGILKEEVNTVISLTQTAQSVFEQALDRYLSIKRETKKFLNNSISSLLDIGMEELDKELNGKKIKKLVMNAR